MSSESILVIHKASVMEIHINRADKMNALTDAMYGAINEALDNAKNNDQVKVVLLRSSGPHFSAGNDLADFLATDFNLKSNVVQFLIKLATLEKPIIAAVNGAAVGIGLTMLLHCDVVYVSEDVKLSVPFVKLGLTPEGGSSQLLAARCSDLKANEWLLTGRNILAEEAVSSGLVNQSFTSANELWEATEGLSQKMARNSLDILVKTKMLLKGEQMESVVKLINKEANIFAEQLKTDEAKAAFAAFLKR